MRHSPLYRVICEATAGSAHCVSQYGIASISTGASYLSLVSSAIRCSSHAVFCFPVPIPASAGDNMSQPACRVLRTVLLPSVRCCARLEPFPTAAAAVLPFLLPLVSSHPSSRESLRYFARLYYLMMFLTQGGGGLFDGYYLPYKECHCVVFLLFFDK